MLLNSDASAGYSTLKIYCANTQTQHSPGFMSNRVLEISEQENSAGTVTSEIP